MLYKLGAVSYLNALPLIHYLPETPVLAAPAALVRLLRIGEVDIAIAPIVSYFENPHYTLLPSGCIASKGPVGSVKLFFTQRGISLENVRSIYLDMESKTSALLLKVLLHFKYRRPLHEITFYTPIPPREVEARLLIGDKAMKELPDIPPVDLGEEWTSWTGLPFVYAAWISRLPEVSERAIEKLTKARQKGCANLASVIPTQVSFPFEFIQKYLENLTYEFGEKERQGMELFRGYCEKLEALPALRRTGTA